MPSPGTHPEGRQPVDLAGFASCWVGVCVCVCGGGGMAPQWPKPCTQDCHLVQAMLCLFPALFLFYPLHWVSFSRPFSATSLGEMGSQRIVAKAYFFL